MTKQATGWAMRASWRCPIDRSVFGAVFAGELARCTALGGDAEAAARLLDRTRDRRNDAVRVMEYFIDLARHAVAYSRGSRKEAIGLALDTAESTRRQTVYGFELLALQVVGFGAAERVTVRLHQLASEVDGELAPVSGAAAAGDGAGLVAASEALEHLGFKLLAAEATDQACHAYWSAGRGHRARAANARTRVGAAVPGCAHPMLWPPSPLPGSPRGKREVAALAGEGRTSRARRRPLGPPAARSRRRPADAIDQHLNAVYARLEHRPWTLAQLRDHLDRSTAWINRTKLADLHHTQNHPDAFTDAFVAAAVISMVNAFSQATHWHR